ncbi:uncharacterized protein LOC116194140 [Punica granatum]|uniref:Uncharacterized protein n=2 Tax=Punica granatum TaxID=22663 RepID=A0A218WGV9_PUNGR|nr:uncharacterized protein LOC116194140 [Punica granatum]OWM71719.1 hypothetical protein CDL15_Pgr005907 [Punica granatum]PKI75710.1 hypothetical protein CRG98_003853 [Punica granatum]
MATNLIPFRPIPVRASASSGHQRPDQAATRNGKASSAGWWTPLFGWSTEPDYIDASSSPITKSTRDPDGGSALGPSSPARSRIAPGGFTEEKARQLRMMTVDTASFHDAMYHSAIASRLASDFGCRPDL